MASTKESIGSYLGYFKHYDVRGIVLCFLSQLDAPIAHRAAFESTVLSFEQVLSEKERRLLYKVWNDCGKKFALYLVLMRL